MYSANRIAESIISCFAFKLNKPITNLLLQKTLYYIQGYSLKWLKKPAFDSEIENWPYGPVVPSVYFEYSLYRDREITTESKDDYEDLDLPIKLRRIIEIVSGACANYTAFELVQKTHSEAPWLNTKRSQRIDNKSIENYFSMHDPLEIE